MQISFAFAGSQVQNLLAKPNKIGLDKSSWLNYLAEYKKKRLVSQKLVD